MWPKKCQSIGLFTRRPTNPVILLLHNRFRLGADIGPSSWATLIPFQVVGPAQVTQRPWLSIVSRASKILLPSMVLENMMRRMWVRDSFTTWLCVEGASGWGVKGPLDDDFWMVYWWHFHGLLLTIDRWMWVLHWYSKNSRFPKGGLLYLNPKCCCLFLWAL